MMLEIPDNVRQDLIRMVPSSLIREISCFSFYDHHPRDEKNIDIIICTTHGEIKEYFRREQVQSIFIENCQPTEIKILRNNKCDLFYLIASKDELIILSRKNTLLVQHRVNNVDRYDIDDSSCVGQATLKIVRKDDAVPLIFNDNYTALGDGPDAYQIDSAETLTLIENLKTKLTEVTYSFKCNVKAYKEIVNLRRLTGFASYQNSSPHLCDALFKGDDETDVRMTVKTKKPWVKVCNKKIIVVLEVSNNTTETMEDVTILLHGTNGPVMVYSTKLFTETPTLPYWNEKQSQNIDTKSLTTIISIIKLKELKRNVNSRIEFNGVISYKCHNKECMLPFEDVVISAVDFMGENFDALSSRCDVNDKYVLLSLLATSERTNLSLRHIRNETEANINLIDLICKYLQFDRIDDTNVVIHRTSPYHVLYGLLAIVEQDVEESCKDNWSMSLYTRSSSQVLAFMHYVHDAIPHRIVISANTQKITATKQEHVKYNEELTVGPVPNRSYMEYATSVLNQTRTLLEYLDKCMVKMNESKNPVVLSKIGTEIDFFACGESSYFEFRSKMLELALKGIKSIEKGCGSADTGSEGMEIDID